MASLALAFDAFPNALLEPAAAQAAQAPALRVAGPAQQQERLTSSIAARSTRYNAAGFCYSRLLCAAGPQA